MSVEIAKDDVMSNFRDLTANDDSWRGRFEPAQNLIESFLNGNEHAGNALVQATEYGPEVEFALWDASNANGKKAMLIEKISGLKNSKKLQAIFSDNLSDAALVIKEFQLDRRAELESSSFRKNRNN